MSEKKPETKPCAFATRRSESGAPLKLCGAPVPIHEWPADGRWPILCRDHLSTYAAPLFPRGSPIG